MATLDARILPSRLMTGTPRCWAVAAMMRSGRERSSRRIPTSRGRSHSTGQPEIEWARTVIERQTRHLVRLVDDLLDVSRMVRGKIVLKIADL